MKLSSKLYAAMPVWGQHLAVTGFGLYWKWLRFGPGYGDFVRDYEHRERMNWDQWRTWQAERVRRILTAAANHVPYYVEHWSASEKNAARAGRLDELPLLDKEPVRSNPRAFLRTDRRPLLKFTFHTSGSTGTPIASIWTPREMRDKLAVREARSARWAGVSFRMPRATFSGRIVAPDENGPIHRYNRVEQQVYFSAFLLRPDTASQYVEALRKHRIAWMTGYAVSYYLLARFILEQGLEPPPLKAVVTTSEKLTPKMREVMEEAYQCRVYEEYSTVENALFASECEFGRLHVSPDVSLVEILRPDGSPCEPGEVGEVVTTGLMRAHQPFVRYRVGDLACWDAEPCPCGRHLPVFREVVGRVEDVVVGPDGRRVVRFHGIFLDQPHIREGQIVQEARDQIRVRVVPTPGFSVADEWDVIERVRARLGPAVHVEVEPVERIERTAAGKFKAVVSLLPAESQA